MKISNYKNFLNESAHGRNTIVDSQLFYSFEEVKKFLFERFRNIKEIDEEGLGLTSKFIVEANEWIEWAKQNGVLFGENCFQTLEELEMYIEELKNTKTYKKYGNGEFWIEIYMYKDPSRNKEVHRDLKAINLRGHSDILRFELPRIAYLGIIDDLRELDQKEIWEESFLPDSHNIIGNLVLFWWD